MDAKPWWSSKTLWVNAVALIASLTAALGFDLGLDDQTQASLVGGVMAVVNIALRLVTTKPLSAKKEKPE